MSDIVEDVLHARYYQPGETSWEDVARRVANYIGDTDVERGEYFRLIRDKVFLPNSPCLMNAGTAVPMLSACFSIGLSDDINSILHTFHNAAIVMKYGGGVGIDFSPLRPKDTPIKSTGGTSSGPIEFMKLFDAHVETIKQGGCVSSKTRIQTKSGYNYIGSLVDCPPFSDTQIQESVLCKYGYAFAGLSQDNGYADTLVITTNHGYSIECTPNHLILVMCDDGNLVWKQASDINKDDWVIIKRGHNIVDTNVKLPSINIDNYHFNTNTSINIPDTLDNDLAYLIGLYMADGCISGNRMIISIGDADNDIKNEVYRIAQKYNLHISEQRKPNDKSINCFMSSVIFIDLFKMCNFIKQDSLHAFVPEYIFKSPENIICAFLRGLYSGDGGVHESGYPLYTTASKQLCTDVQLLLQSIGVFSKITVNTYTKNKFGNNPVYILRICDEYGLKYFKNNIGFTQTRQNEKLKLNINCKTQIIPYAGSVISKYYNPVGGRDTTSNPQLAKEIERYIRGDRNISRPRLEYICNNINELDNNILSDYIFSDDICFSKIVNIENSKCYTVDIETDEHNYVANGIIVHNKRRGAAISTLDVSHPDIEEFITCKTTEGKLANMNISVRITDKFMEAVETDGDWNLEYDGVVYKTIKATDLYNLICESAWKYGEPGIIFIDEIKKNNPYFGTEYDINVNPCGEVTLMTCDGGGESCNLGSIDVSKYYIPEYDTYDSDMLEEDIRTAIRFLDRVIDKNFYPIPEIETMTKKFRRLGLGIMGWHDLLIKMQIPYDSNRARELAKDLMSNFNRVCASESARIGASFGMPDYVVMTDAEYGDALESETSYRNIARTCIAPTGTIATIAECSYGIEPVFSYVHNRYTWVNGEKIGYKQMHPQFEHDLLTLYTPDNAEYDKIINHMFEFGTIQDLDYLPTWFRKTYKTAMDISYENHILMQATFQEDVDNNISKTVNLPNDATVDTINRIYKMAWKCNLKGVTVYRSGSRETEVLELAKLSPKTEEVIMPKEENTRRQKILNGTTYKMQSGCGKLYITINERNGRPYEVFVQTAGSGGCQANSEAIGRLISLALRNGVPSKEIIKQLKRVKCAAAIKNGCDGKSCADIIAKCIEEFYSVIDDDGDSDVSVVVSDEKLTIPQDLFRPKCPECGEYLTLAEGCMVCGACGWSKCK